MPSNPASPQDKGYYWSITFWMTSKTGYTRDDLDQFTSRMPSRWGMIGQEEKGKESGDHHFQLCLHTPDQPRARAVMTAFPKCHVEVARKPIALKQYVQKEDTRVGEFKTIVNKSPQWHAVVSQFASWIITNFPDLPDEPKEETRLSLWDDFIRASIVEGMRLDIVGVNPQYRSCILKYWTAYMEVAKSVQDNKTQDNNPGSPSTIISDSSITICPVESTPVSPVLPKLVRVVAPAL